MQKKLHIKKGDTVVVIAGKERGKEGVVQKVDRKSNRAIVEGLNLVKKHEKPTPENPQGGITEVGAGIHLSNLMLVHKGSATRVGRKMEGDQLVRYAKKTGEIIE